MRSNNLLLAYTFARLLFSVSLVALPTYQRELLDDLPPRIQSTSTQLAPSNRKVLQNSGQSLFLIEAAKYGRYSEVKQLLSEGADPNFATVEGFTPLSMAAVNNYGDVITLLLSNGASIDKATSRRPGGDIGLLYLACRFGSTDAAEALLDAGAQVDALNVNGFGPLHGCAEDGFVETANLLLDNGATVDLPSGDLRFPITFAIIGGHLSMVRLLLSRGADVNSMAEGKQFTPLSYAADYPSGLIIQELLDSGADIDAQSDKGLTPLFYAAQYGNKIGIEVLVLNGADKTIEGFGMTPKEALCACTTFVTVPDICQVDACENQSRMLSLLS